MATIHLAPTSPGQRFTVKVVHPNLHKGKPEKSLLEKYTKTGGRNHSGRMTCRHMGGGHKRRYRVIDFKRQKTGVPARVVRLEYDPNRTAHIALLLYKDGEKRYILAPHGLKVNDEVISGRDVPIKIGHCLPLSNIPVGTVIHGIEMQPLGGAKIARSAGAFAQLIAREGAYVTLRMRSGEIRKILAECWAVIGTVSNIENNLRVWGKAGAKRHLGIRPTVRGTAMNPVDHPHGGGEGRTKGGRHPVSPWGVLTKGYKTRKNKRTSQFILRNQNK